jgi:Phage tail sheath C-terminal domain
MALNSPGVEVKVIDESFYVPAEPGTRPLIVVSTKENKRNGSGTGIAVGTLKANAGKPYLLTSQRDLSDFFGTPLFYTDSSQNPIHGGELNEYGLQAAYSYLGVSNSAWVVRSDLDLGQLVPSATAPSATPDDGTYWFDTRDTHFGVFEWNGSPPSVSGGQKFTNKTPIVITDITLLDAQTSAPLGSIGKMGDYCVVAGLQNVLYYKNKMGDWVEVGSPDWTKSIPTIQSTKSNPTLTAGAAMVISGTTITVPTAPNNNINGVLNAIYGLTGASAGNTDPALRVTSIIQNGAVTAAIPAGTGRLELYCDSTENGIQIQAPGGISPPVSLVQSSAAGSQIGIAIGNYNKPVIALGPHTQIPRFKYNDPTPRPSGSLWVKTTNVNLGAHWIVKEWSSTLNDWVIIPAPVYPNNNAALYNLDRAGGGQNIARGALYVQYNVDEDLDPKATFTIFRRELPAPTSITSGVITGTTFVNGTTYSFIIAETQIGKATLSSDIVVSFTATHSVSDANELAAAINAAMPDGTNIIANVDSRNRLVIRHEIGGDFRLTDGTNNPLSLLRFIPYDYVTNSGTTNLYTAPGGDTHDYVATNWKQLKAISSNTVPNQRPADGTLWYNQTLDQVDIMIHNGTTWVGYQYNDPSNPNHSSPYYSSDENFKTDPNGPIITATKPKTQSDGTPLNNGDIWIDTGDVENYPAMYKYDYFNLKWVAIDNKDQTTEDGVLFADARNNVNGTNSDKPGAITDLLVSDFLDPDAPDPDLYPRGMLLFNTRRSGNNVKRYIRNYIDPNHDNYRFNTESQEDYFVDRWVNESGNAADGHGLFGRHAQRKVVVKHLKAMVDTNQSLRETEIRTFNLIVCPGYVELIANMVNLNIDRKQTAFVIGDTPFRLPSDATSINDWGTNARLAVDNGEDALVSYDEYLGVYYPSGYTTDNNGNNIVVPASHMVLRSIALSDGVSYPWFAPAGTRRGKVSNATSVGYVDAMTGEWQSISLNEGQRDTLYAVAINPITFLTGAGIVIFGQKTRASNASALDRVNVARLVVYLRGQLTKLAKPYIFEPNDKITRDELKAAAESIMLELVGQRGIYDYLVVCDDSNNTPARIDRNELYLDIAIEPVKAVEFIYIPLRLKNTGEIAGLGK